MAEREREDKGELHRGRTPESGKRKPPSETRRGLAPKRAADEPGHGEGSSHLFAALKDVPFPATRREVIDAVGNRVIALPDGSTVPVATVVEKTTLAEFGSARDLVSEANAVWDDVERAAHGE